MNRNIGNIEPFPSVAEGELRRGESRRGEILKIKKEKKNVWYERVLLYIALCTFSVWRWWHISWDCFYGYDVVLTTTMMMQQNYSHCELSRMAWNKNESSSELICFKFRSGK